MPSFISTNGIQSGSLIEASQVLNIINALNGVTSSNIQIGGALILSSSTPNGLVLQPGALTQNNVAPTTLTYDTGSGIV